MTKAHVTAAADQAVAAVRSGDAEEIERVLVKTVGAWFSSRPPEIADEDVEDLAWALASSAQRAPEPPAKGESLERVAPWLYSSHVSAGRREEARVLWQGLALSPRMGDRRTAAMASIRLVQALALLARCHELRPSTQP